MASTVSEVATLANVSVRTLHHYDAIGLLSPSARSEAGYRLYERRDLERLQQILFFRELGFSLEEIRRACSTTRASTPWRRSWSSASCSRRRRRDCEAMIGAVDRALEAGQKGIAMDEKDMFEVFGDFDPKQYEDEARERWGDTDAYKESARRTARYTKEDWQRIKAEQDAIEAEFAEAMAAGKAPDSAEAHGARRAGAAGHRRSVLPLQPRDAREPGHACTSPTRASRSTTRTGRRAWPSTCATPSWPTRRAGSRRGRLLHHLRRLAQVHPEDPADGRDLRQQQHDHVRRDDDGHARRVDDRLERVGLGREGRVQPLRR